MNGTKMRSRENSEALILLIALDVQIPLMHPPPPSVEDTCFFVEVSCSSHHPFKKVGQELVYAYLSVNVGFGEKGVSHFLTSKNLTESSQM